AGVKFNDRESLSTLCLFFTDFRLPLSGFSDSLSWIPVYPLNLLPWLPYLILSFDSRNAIG
ncbi:MAG: hypothetical protein ACI3W6_03925, partial [Clostridia bacterium]